MLLKVAKQAVPRLQWKRTPVVLRATAGLRLLPAEKAQALLDQVLPFDSLQIGSAAHGRFCLSVKMPGFFLEVLVGKTIAEFVNGTNFMDAEAFVFLL